MEKKQTQKNPWNEYTEEYRRRNPEKVARWKYNAAVKLIRRYEAEHPECKAERLAGEA